ncbi:MAG: DnaJ domain-containing protein [Alphaproteobacteria bacterium]|nr:DnaJ domain-containing protein [Alphaproteobacteria bacterium]
MKLDSKYFDNIRIKPDKKNSSYQEGLECNWNGCKEIGKYPAPKGRNREGEYFQLCLKHIRDYNRSYDYFSGMSDDEVAGYLQKSRTDHQPTWAVGMRTNKMRTKTEKNASLGQDMLGDSSGFFRKKAEKRKKKKEKTTETRIVYEAERKAFGILGLNVDSSTVRIKDRYKELVKRHHPDANGNDPSSEDKLRDIIQAYGYLKSIKRC